MAEKEQETAKDNREKKVVEDNESATCSQMKGSQGSKIIVVGIGASAGGLEALKQLIPGLPSKDNMCFIIAQHLDPKHRSLLASLLERHTEMPVLEANDGASIEANHIYITPPGKDVTLSRGRLILSKPLADIGPKPSVDYFFTSLAEEQGDRAVGVILSGTGSDGSHGIRAIKAGGGITIVQTEESAKYNGMPHAAIETGHVDIVLNPENIGPELASLTSYPRLIPRTPAEQEIPLNLNHILTMINDNVGVDFSDYKMPTINRRIGRRMALHKISSIADYVNYIKREPGELDSLFKDILISVTGFFRDGEAFQSLYRIFEKIIENKKSGDSIRFWIPGCATGEEVYSIAIILAEILGSSINKYNIQIFGTDLDGDAILRARKGLYPSATTADMEKRLIEKYFINKESSVQIIKSIREMIVFARQNLTKDPPFSHLDFISCRNLLIYFNTTLQRKLVQMFHYVLNPGGILFLGKSETIGQFSELFEPAVKKWKIYRRRDTLRVQALEIGGFRRMKGFADVSSPPQGNKKQAIVPGTGFW